MGLPIIYDDDGQLLTLPGSLLGGLVWDVHPLIQSPPFHVDAPIVITTPPETYAVFKLPDLYNYYPEIVRWMDRTYVSRDDIPLYYWDSVPRWDAEPFTWDEVLGPEPILKTTTRIIQMELEKSAQEISDLLKMYNIETCDAATLPYHAALLGTPLPAGSPAEQRSFLRELGQTYRKKGTPLSFYRLFESLGFTLILQENYQRKSDGELLDGPQIDLVSTNYVPDEAVGTTPFAAATIQFHLLNVPVSRGSVLLEIYDNSTTEPTYVKDDGEGNWTRGYGGSIDYRTGTCYLQFPSTPALSGQPITASYHYLADPFPDPHEINWTDRWRSSVVYVGLVPNNSSISLTEELTDRLLLYLNLLKPAHVIVEDLEVIFDGEEDEGANLDDNLDLLAYLHAESLFGTLYLGYGWASEDNASLNHDPLYLYTQGRLGNEFLNDFSDPPGPAAHPFGVTPLTPLGAATFSDSAPASPSAGDLWVDTSAAPAIYTLKICGEAAGPTWRDVQTVMNCDPTRYPDVPPYTYPMRLNGLFFQPTPGPDTPGVIPPLPGSNWSEAYWGEYDPPVAVRFDALVTADISPPTTTNFSLDFGAGTTLGAGDHVVVNDGPAGGEATFASVFTDVGPGNYYDVTVLPALPVAPEVGDSVTVLLSTSVNLKNTILRPQDPLALYFVESLYSAARLPVPHPLTLSYFGQFDENTPLLPNYVEVHFTVDVTGVPTDFVEYDDGAGNISNLNGWLHATVPSTIDYVTGELVLEFAATGPSAGTEIVVKACALNRYTEALYSLTRLPPPDPGTLSYSGQMAANVPIEPYSVTVSFTIDVTGVPTPFTETDDGAGNISNLNGWLHATVPSTIDYATGELVLEFAATGPNAGTDISLRYAAALLNSSELGDY